MKILFWYNCVKTNQKGLAQVMMPVTYNGQRLNMSTHIEIE